MLPKINRLKKKKDFENIFKNSKIFKNILVSLRLCKNGLSVSRVGFVVSLKVSKKATIRNKIRRRLSAAVKIFFNNIKTGDDLLLVALPGIEKK